MRHSSRALGPAYLALGGASQILLARFYWYDDRYVAQSLLFYAFALSALYALSRPVPLRRLWAGLIRSPAARAPRVGAPADDKQAEAPGELGENNTSTAAL